MSGGAFDLAFGHKSGAVESALGELLPGRGRPGLPPLADDMVAMFRFGNGFCDFRSRYVRTPRFVAERAARRSLFGAYRNPFTDDLSVAGLSRGLANTNVYWHGGRLLASKEDSPLPFHYRHPVTGKDFVPDSWGAFPA